MDREEFIRKANLKKRVLNLEWNVDRDNEFFVYTYLMEHTRCSQLL